MSLRTCLLSFVTLALLVAAAPAPRHNAPSITLDAATFVGNSSGTVHQFLGIPFVQPPTGDRRFRLPEPIVSYPAGTRQATAFGHSCPQEPVQLPIPDGLPASVIDSINNLFNAQLSSDSEDCLTVNVVKPALVPANTKLPVVVWIHGGAFAFGGTSSYDGAVIVNESINMGKPVIYVSMNYRLAGFGFLSGKEVKAAGVSNLGLQDQRQALRWIQKYISAFGGDPTKVTIWGESAGAMSSSFHMITNGGNTEGLFRAAFMQSGAPIPLNDITDAQDYYDHVVSAVGCSSASDTLQCLRTIDYTTLKKTMSSTPSGGLPWFPVVDGLFLTESPPASVAKGTVAKIPYVSGNCDDEGTIFVLSQSNITTDAQALEYMQGFVPGAPATEITKLGELYSSDPSQGSPYGTGTSNALTPQYKRIASFHGDVIFQVPRRSFLKQTYTQQNVWSYQHKRNKTQPFLGSFHGSDILNVYGVGEMRKYLINLATSLDPNGSGLLNWPKWSEAGRESLSFQDGPVPLQLEKDDFREEPINVLTELRAKYSN